MSAVPADAIDDKARVWSITRGADGRLLATLDTERARRLTKPAKDYAG